MRRVLFRLYQLTQLRKDIIYKIYLLLIQMQLRVPNQYKPSFLENLLSPFVPVPTRRILSDKKIQKQKKINLSLTDDNKNKSNRKIKISNSFDMKATPSTNERHTNNVSQFSTLRRGIDTENRGLNFHPRKINFQNELSQKVKKRSHIYIGPFFNHNPSQESQELLTLERNENQGQQSKCHIRDKRMATFFSTYHPVIENKPQTQCRNPNPELMKSYDKALPKASISTKNKTENTDKKQMVQEACTKAPKQSIISPSLRGLLKNKAKLQLKQCPVKQPDQKDNQIYITKAQSYKEEQNPPFLNHVTPKNNRNGASIKTENGKNVPNHHQQVTSLFDNALTIESKNDDSSKRSNSDCYSNVIERIKVEEIKYQIDEGPKQWEEMRRKSLNANLLSKYQQNKQPMHNTRQTAMDFRKKKDGITESDYRFSSRTEFDDLKYIEETYINSTVGYLPFSTVSQQPIVKTQRRKTIYEVFNKVNYLGVGRFASVYLCVTEANFIFAMKQILKFTVMYNSVEKQLRNELEIQYSCNHPHILNLYDFWGDDKKYYLALEYGQQTLLNKIEKNTPLPEQECLRYIEQICKGLEYLHQRGIVHRDIKPENVILVNGICKIGDFGWATKIESGLLKDPCGTPCYISPQMDKSETYSTKTDCWSLGILAYELINGKLDEEHFGRGIHPASLTFKPNISKEYKNLVFTLLSEDEISRPSISEVLTMPIFRNE